MPNPPLFPVEASTNAGKVDLLMLALLLLSGAITLGIVVAISYFAVKYRRGAVADRSNPLHTSLKIELAWTLIPLALSAGVFIWAGSLFFSIHRPPADSMEIYVVGRQWMWKFQHPEGPGEINQLHVPVNRPIKLVMTSQDVIHSLYVPAFRLKQDVLPGVYTTLWFQATLVGQFHLFCAEYCGTQHAEMGGQVVVMPPDEFAAWLNAAANQAGVGPAGSVQATPATMQEGGQALFRQLGCSSCHLADAGGIGPSLVGVYGSQVQLEGGQTVTADDNYIRESILNPHAKLVQGYPPVMPSFEGQVTEEQLLQLIAYIKSLPPGDAAQGQEGGQAQ